MSVSETGLAAKAQHISEATVPGLIPSPNSTACHSSILLPLFSHPHDEEQKHGSLYFFQDFQTASYL